MIRNDRQLANAEKKRAELLKAASMIDDEGAAVYEDLANEVQREIDEYVAVREGNVNLFTLDSVDDLAESLIKARVARGWTQKDLAEALGVTEQMVQKDESGGYEKAGVARIAEIVDVLGYQLIGELRPVHLPHEQWRGPAGVTFGVPIRNWTVTYPHSFPLLQGHVGATRALNLLGAIAGFKITTTEALEIKGIGNIFARSPNTVYPNDDASLSQTVPQLVRSGR